MAAALGAGDLNVAQAQVITHALDELPTDEAAGRGARTTRRPTWSRRRRDFGPRELRVLGRRILDIVAPEIGEQHEAEQLAAEERRAERRTSLVSTRLGDGTTRITINVPDAVATRLHTYLEAFTSPRHAGRGAGRGRATGSRSTASAARRSARCWRPSTPSGCRPTAATPPR